MGGSRPRWAGPGRSGAGPGRSEQGQAERDRGEGLRHRQGQSQDGAHGAPGEGVVRVGQIPCVGDRRMTKHLDPGRKDGQGCLLLFDRPHQGLKHMLQCL